MEIYEVEPGDALTETLLALSADWEAENTCRGYRRNTPADLVGGRIFLAEEGEKILGYLLAREAQAQRDSSVMKTGTPFFEIEELYVRPQARNRGIGRALYRFAAGAAKEAGMACILLSTATRDYRRVLHFYLEELGMEFWSATLFENLTEER